MGFILRLEQNFKELLKWPLRYICYLYDVFLQSSILHIYQAFVINVEISGLYSVFFEKNSLGVGVMTQRCEIFRQNLILCVKIKTHF